MNWGRKKPSSSSSSSQPHFISHVFPLSWLSKFKRKSQKTSSKPLETNQKEKPHQILQKASSVKSPKNSIPSYYWDSKLYTQDNDGFWRLSSNKENTEGVNEKLVVPSNYGKDAATKKRTHKAKVLKTEILPEKGLSGNKEAVKNRSLQKTYSRIVEATEELHRELDEVNEYRKSVEKELSDSELLRVMQIMGRADERLPSLDDSEKSPSVIIRNYGEFHQDNKRSEWQKLKDAKIKEVLLKNNKHRKSFHVGRGSSKIRVSSPKTPLKMEPCKIEALENMKKAKMKKKMKELELELKDKESNLGSFAVVKSSHDPQQDFRDSMLEMIMEKRITRPEELEELLACYLTLNANEYHDIIIKVFRQVWHELEKAA